MQASIADILENPYGFADRIVNIDGILLIADYDRGSAQFDQVWLVKQDAPRNRAIRAQPIRSASTLWHGLSRLNPRHLPGYQVYRIHDAVRACVRVLGESLDQAAPVVEVLTAAVYRQEFTLYVGEQGVRLDQALPARTPIRLAARDPGQHRAISRPTLPYLWHLDHPFGAAGAIPDAGSDSLRR